MLATRDRTRYASTNCTSLIVETGNTKQEEETGEELELRNRLESPTYCELRTRTLFPDAASVLNTARRSHDGADNKCSSLRSQ